MIALQCYVGFCHIVCESAISIRISPLSWVSFPSPLVKVKVDQSYPTPRPQWTIQSTWTLPTELGGMPFITVPQMTLKLVGD